MATNQWNRVKENIGKVLSKQNSPVKVNSFWNVYQKQFGNLPELSIAPTKIASRSEFLALSDICDIFTDDSGVKFARLKTANVPDTAAKTSITPDTTGKPTKSEKAKSKKKRTAADARKSDTNVSRGSQFTTLKDRSTWQPLEASKTSESAAAVPALLSIDFPELGASAEGAGDAGDEMAMRNNHHAHQSYHPYQQHDRHERHDRREQQHDPGNSFYRQYYSAHTPTPPRVVPLPPPGVVVPVLRSAPLSSLSSGKRPSFDQLDVVAKEAVVRLAEAKEYVSYERVEKLILQHFNASHVDQLGVRNLEQVPAVRELNMARGKVNAYIHAFMRAHSSCTLHELQKGLESYCCKGGDFESLNCGPLQSQPLVYDYFRFPEKSAIPELTCSDLLDELQKWIAANNLWRDRNLGTHQFLEHLQVSICVTINNFF